MSLIDHQTYIALYLSDFFSEELNQDISFKFSELNQIDYQVLKEQRLKLKLKIQLYHQDNFRLSVISDTSILSAFSRYFLAADSDFEFKDSHHLLIDQFMFWILNLQLETLFPKFNYAVQKKRLVDGFHQLHFFNDSEKIIFSDFSVYVADKRLGTMSLLYSVNFDQGGVL